MENKSEFASLTLMEKSGICLFQEGKYIGNFKTLKVL